MNDTGPIAVAAASATIPSTVSLDLGTQVLESIDDPGSFEVVVRICSLELPSETLVDEIAVPIAQAIQASELGGQVTYLSVSSYVPDSAGVPQQATIAIAENYEDYLWDAQVNRLGNGFEVS